VAAEAFKFRGNRERVIYMGDCNESGPRHVWTHNFISFWSCNCGSTYPPYHDDSRHSKYILYKIIVGSRSKKHAIVGCFWEKKSPISYLTTCYKKREDFLLSLFLFFDRYLVIIRAPYGIGIYFYKNTVTFFSCNL